MPVPKINLAIARQIRADRAGGMTYTELAKKYGITRGSICAVVKEKTWKEPPTGGPG